MLELGQMKINSINTIYNKYQVPKRQSYNKASSCAGLINPLSYGLNVSEIVQRRLTINPLSKESSANKPISSQTSFSFMKHIVDECESMSLNFNEYE